MATELVILYSLLILCLQPSFCLLSFPAWVFFQSQFFTSGGQSIGVLALTSVLPMNIQEWFPSGWTGWISLESRGLSRGFSSTTIQSINSSVLRLMVQLSHTFMTTGKTIALTRRTFVGKVMSLLFNMLSGFVIAFPPRGKHILIVWLQSPSTAILSWLPHFPFYLPRSDGTRCLDLSFLNVEL